MVEEPDMKFDIDALFNHLVNNLNENIEDVRDWAFFLRSSSVETLERIADEVQDEFTVQLQEDVEEFDNDGNSTMGAPLLIVIQRGALTPEDVKALAERFSTLAAKRGVTYEGVECYEAVDEDEADGWLTPEEAAWRLRHFSDCGLDENAELGWAFLVVADDEEQMHNVTAELEKNGFEELTVDDEPDEDGSFGIAVFVAGRNNEVELAQACEKIEGIAGQHGAKFGGVQFCDIDCDCGCHE